MKPVLHVWNATERGILTAQGSKPGMPVSRLGDGDVGLFWEDTTTDVHRTILLDMGTSVPSGSFCVAAGHNMVGKRIALDSAPTAGGPWTNRANIYPASAAAACVTFTQTAARYWLMTFVDAPLPAPRLSEWALTIPIVLPSGPQEPSLVVGPLGNVQTYESPGGYAWTRKRGAPRWEADYLIRDLTEFDKGQVEWAFAQTDEGARPFFLEDADGLLRWVYWLPEGGKVSFQAEGRTRWRTLLRFREAL